MLATGAWFLYRSHPGGDSMSGVAEERPSTARAVEQSTTRRGAGSRRRSLLVAGLALAAGWTLFGVLSPSDGAAAAEQRPASLGSLLGGAGDGLTSVVDSATDAVDATVGGAVAVVDAAAPVAAPLTQIVVEQGAAPVTAAVDSTTGAAVGAVVGTTAPVVEIVDEVVADLPALPTVPTPEPPATDLPGAPAPSPAPTQPAVDLVPGLDPALPADQGAETDLGAASSAALPAALVGSVGIAVAAEPSTVAGPVPGAGAELPAPVGAPDLLSPADDPTAHGPLAGDPVAVSSVTAGAAPGVLGAAMLDASGAPQLDAGRTAPPRDDRLPVAPSSDSVPSPD